MEKSSYDSSFGKIVIQKRFSVRQPKDPEEREKFFNYLREKGLFEDMVSVNSMTLNAYYKQELETARQEGNFDFAIPGLSEPTVVEYVTLRRK